MTSRRISPRRFAEVLKKDDIDRSPAIRQLHALLDGEAPSEPCLVRCISLLGGPEELPELRHLRQSLGSR